MFKTSEFFLFFAGTVMFCAIVLCSVYGANAQTSDVLPNDEELKSIRNKIQNTRTKFDLYKQKEQNLKTDLQKLKSVREQTEKKRRDVDLNFNIAKKEKVEEEQKYTAYDFAYKRLKGSLKREFLKYFILEKTNDFEFGYKKLVSRLFLKFAICKNIMLINELKTKNEEVEKNLSGLETKTQNLAGAISQLKKKEQNTRFKLKDKQTTLKKTRTEAKKIEDEINKLKKTETELVAILIKQKQQSVEKMLGAKPTLSIPRHSLVWPVVGKVISSFGRKKIDSLGVEFDREGIKIETSQNAEVKSIKTGVVIYKGFFRSYGNVIIVDHGSEFFSIYGLLDEFFVKKGNAVTEGKIIGKAGSDNGESLAHSKVPRGKSVLYFEIRSGTKPLNPLDWLKER